MNKFLFSFLIVNLMFVFSAQAQEQTSASKTKKKVATEVFTVYGNCGMCERTIEGSLTGVKEIKKAGWDKDSDQMTVSFNPTVISFDQIKQRIADVGYDSDSHRATDEVYNNLPGCCQYDRPVR
ncbi:MAG: heavy-metal-associated domain-containing protein [Saprospiraceae bacterium]|nr:heavy-metal-associated domain-containing protein [Saprospiraceae bacterium]